MADRKSAGGDIANAVAAIAGLVAAVTPIVTKALDKKKENSEKEEWITVPALYDKAFPLKLEQAVELLSGYGLKAIPSMLTLKEASPKYKDCSEGQVIGSKPKSGQKARIGTTVLVRCIPQEVVDESLRLFVESEKEKAAGKAERDAKRAEQAAKAKEMAIGAAGRAKTGIEKIVPHRSSKTNRKEPSHE